MAIEQHPVLFLPSVRRLMFRQFAYHSLRLLAGAAVILADQLEPEPALGGYEVPLGRPVETRDDGVIHVMVAPGEFLCGTPAGGRAVHPWDAGDVTCEDCQREALSDPDRVWGPGALAQLDGVSIADLLDEHGELAIGFPLDAYTQPDVAEGLEHFPSVPEHLRDLDLPWPARRPGVDGDCPHAWHAAHDTLD